MSQITGHNKDFQGLERLADVTKDILEGKTHIYELVAELTEEEATDFITKAQAAMDEGKTSFMFDGKTYPVSLTDQVLKKFPPAEETGDGIESEELDPVGKEDDDVDNDGDVDDSDEYLKKKRDAIDKAIDDEEEVDEEVDEEVLDEKASEEENDDESGVYKDNDEIAPDTESDVEGEDDVEEKDGEEEESEEPKAKKEDFDLALVGKLIGEGIDLDEGKMKDLHDLVFKGIKDPKKIVKELGLKPSKDTFDAISSLIAGMK